MADILAYPSTTAATRRTPRRPGVLGEVVIFPGVRVEYHEGWSWRGARQSEAAEARDRLNQPV